jgi:hypothetical protein
LILVQSEKIVIKNVNFDEIEQKQLQREIICKYGETKYQTKLMINIGEQLCLLLRNILKDYHIDLVDSITRSQFKILESLWMSIDIRKMNIGSRRVISEQCLKSFLISILQLVLFISVQCQDLYIIQNIFAEKKLLIELLLKNSSELKELEHQKLIFALFKSCFEIGEYLTNEGMTDQNPFQDVCFDDRINNQLMDYFENIHNLQSSELSIKIRQFANEYFEFD